MSGKRSNPSSSAKPKVSSVPGGYHGMPTSYSQDTEHTLPKTQGYPSNASSRVPRRSVALDSTQKDAFARLSSRPERSSDTEFHNSSPSGAESSQSRNPLKILSKRAKGKEQPLDSEAVKSTENRDYNGQMELTKNHDDSTASAGQFEILVTRTVTTEYAPRNAHDGPAK